MLNEAKTPMIPQLHIGNVMFDRISNEYGILSRINISAVKKKEYTVIWFDGTIEVCNQIEIDNLEYRYSCINEYLKDHTVIRK